MAGFRLFAFLKKILCLLRPYRVSAPAALPAETEAALQTECWQERDVLIGSFRSPAQFAVCKARNFYYIPAERIADEAFPLRYVAMFQTPRIFGKDAGIAFYGKVIRTALVPRYTIAEVPMRSSTNPNALYYRFSVQQWIALEEPIAPAEGAFVHEFTTLFLLTHARRVPELLLQSEAEYRVYTELIRRSAHPNPEILELDGLRYRFTKEEFRIEREDQVLFRCSRDSFAKAPIRNLRTFWGW